MLADVCGESWVRIWADPTAQVKAAGDVFLRSARALDDPVHSDKFDSDQFYVKSAAEMRELFKDVPDACDNTLLIAERVDVKLREGEKPPDVFGRGSSIFADGKLKAFDQESNAKIAEFLKKSDSSNLLSAVAPIFLASALPGEVPSNDRRA